MAKGIKIDETMLPLIRCPASHQTLRLATADELARLNASIANSLLKTVGGETAGEPLEGALIREDGTVVYPIVDGIARLIADDGLKLPEELVLPATQEQADHLAKADEVDGNGSPHS